MLADNERVRAHVRIKGLVQGVYFRSNTEEEARAWGVSGWVRNDGNDVEAVLEGPRHAVETVVSWCHEGPRRAKVEGVQVAWEQPEGLEGFHVRA